MSTGVVPLLQMKYGVNVFADWVYDSYKPLQITAHYPSTEADELKQDIAAYVDCTPNMILVGSGSDEMIDAYIRTYAKRFKKLKVAYSPPTYFQYEAYASRIDVPVIYLPHNRAGIRATQLAEAGCNPKDTVIMLDSPSNPAGEVVARKQFIDMLEAGYHVLADEAYYEFRGETTIDLIPKYPEQLVVTRSFSKFAAMAGSRVGYIIADPAMIDLIRPHKLFFNVASSSQHRARYALKHAEEFMQAISTMRTTKRDFVKDAESLDSYIMHPALDLYVIFSHKTMSAKQVHDMLLKGHDIETYLIENFKDKGAVIRATVMEQPLMQRLLDAMKAIA
jgi:histidinol-phosphate aminotransferase